MELNSKSNSAGASSVFGVPVCDTGYLFVVILASDEMYRAEFLR